MLKRVSSNQQSNQTQFNPIPTITNPKKTATAIHCNTQHKYTKAENGILQSTFQPNPIQANTRISISANLPPPQKKKKNPMETIQRKITTKRESERERERESTRGSGESKRNMGVEANGGSHGRGSVHHSMFSGEDDFPWSSSFHFHCFSLKFQFYSFFRLNFDAPCFFLLPQSLCVRFIDP
jgi:hypothetical protein